MDIIVDTIGETSLTTKDRLFDSDDDDVKLETTGDKPLSSYDLLEDLPADKKRTKKQKRACTKDIDLDEFEREMGWTNRRKQQPKEVSNVSYLVETVCPIQNILKKSAIKPGFEQLDSLPRYDESRRRLQRKRRKIRAKTAGKMWYNMSAPEMTEELKHDLEVIQMRSALDPKHFYKKNDLKVLPKYFQIGKVIDTPLDYYSGRLTKKERKKTIVDELMADAEFSKYNKRKYKEIIDEKKKLHYKAHKHAKKLKGRKKQRS